MCVQGVELRHTEEEFKKQVQQLEALGRKLEELDQRTR